MDKKSKIYTLFWDDNFVLMNKEKTSDNDIFLYIDEESKYMKLTFPSNIDLITRRNLERQLRQIQKRGFLIEELNKRIGKEFEYHIDEEIEDSQKVEIKEKISKSTDIEKLEQLILEIKQIWIHKRKGEGVDMTDSLENGQPSHFVTFLTSNYQRLNILISSLPNSISFNGD